VDPRLNEAELYRATLVVLFRLLFLLYAEDRDLLVATPTSPGNDSRAAQEAAVRRLGGDNVLLLVDWNYSGSRADRPAYLQLKAIIQADEVASAPAYSPSPPR